MSNRSFKQLSLAISCCLLLNGCACQDTTHTTNSNKYSNEIATAGVGYVEGIQQAVAIINPTQQSGVRGRVTFTKVTNGLRIVADLEGLTPGEHGFHVHEFGDCGRDGEAAGAHFNPTKRNHGGPTSEDRHAGDLGNITADANGRAHYDRVDSVLSLSGENSVIGHSIVVHQDRDDYTTQPSGASGKRIGCGVIEAVTVQ